MFNIKRFDPSQPSVASSSTSTPATTDGLTDLARKIEERQKKRKADALLSTSTSSSSAPPPAPAAAPVVAEWKPAEGESPAEREKREKREKRAARMGTGGGGVSFDLRPAPPSGSSYVPPPSTYQQRYTPVTYDNNSNDYTPSMGTGAGSIHPSRQQSVPGYVKEKKEKDPNKDKTPAKKRYLKKKKERSKGKKAGEPTLNKKPRKLKKGLDGKAIRVVGEDGESGSSDEEDSDDEAERLEEEEKKKTEIVRKKAERKVKRDEKKAEARKVKAEGGIPIATVARVLATKVEAKVIVVAEVETPMEIDLTPLVPSEPTVEELELQVIEAAKQARKETKRMKRTTRRLTPPPVDESLVIKEPTPETEVEPIAVPAPAPLLRLPGATRPAPPSAKTLSALNVHESVRSKQVVDPERKMSLGEDGFGLSERARKRLGEMGIMEAFAGECSSLCCLAMLGSEFQEWKN